MSKEEGTIFFRLDPSPSPIELERMRNIISSLIESKAFNNRNGQTILHFDNDGLLRKIEKHSCIWQDKGQERNQTVFLETKRKQDDTRLEPATIQHSPISRDR